MQIGLHGRSNCLCEYVVETLRGGFCAPSKTEQDMFTDHALWIQPTWQCTCEAIDAIMT